MLLKYFGPACLAGISLADWLRLLVENGFRISPRYCGKLLYLTVSSIGTSLCRPVESAMYRRRLRRLDVQHPVFVLGCWRSGTTLLHKLLSLDPQFVAPSMYQTMYPHTFLVSDAWLRPFLELLTPGKRFMDNMDQGMREPHEDEMGLAIMSRRSNMLSWAFPNNREHYDAYLDFSRASVQDRDVWKQCLDLFVRRVALKSDRQVVLKSPNHTARIGLILEQYPDAKFLHIRRHPYDVFRSMCHMLSKVQPVWGLQYLDPKTIPDLVIDTYKSLYDAYLDQVHLIPEGHLCEIDYSQLAEAPLNTLGTMYESLNFDNFDVARPHLETYLEASRNYQKNRHADLSLEDRQRLHTAWERFFDSWSWPKGVS